MGTDKMVVYRSPRGHPDSEFVEGPDNQTLYRIETDTSCSLQAKFQQQTSTPDADLFQMFQTYCKCSRCRPIPGVPDLLQVCHTYSRFSRPISIFPEIIHFIFIQTYSWCPRYTAGRLNPDVPNLLQVFETLACVLDLLGVSHLLQIYSRPNPGKSQYF